MGKGTPPPPDPSVLRDFFRALSEPDRIRIAGRLAGDATTVPGLAAELGISLRDCGRHVALLAGLGLVCEEAGNRPPLYRLNARWLRDVSRALLDSPRSLALDGATDERSRVVAAFFRDGRLLSLPSGDARKLIVLAEVARQFASGRTYTEREVSATLKQIYEYDYVTLRRLLVDFCFLNRANGVYWIGEGRRDPALAPSQANEA